MEILSKGYNNFEEKYKDIDVDAIDNDSQTYDRQYLEFLDKYDQRISSEYDMFLKEFDLASNYSEELYRRTKIKYVIEDAQNHMNSINAEFIKELKELEEKYEKKTTYPYYRKWMFTGDSRDYKNLLTGLTYYIKLMSENKIQIYYDVKFTEYLGEYDIVDSDWKQII